MSIPCFIFPQEVHIITKDKQALILNQESKKWVTLSTASFQALKAYLAGGIMAEDAEVEGIQVHRIKHTIEYLASEGFLINPNKAILWSEANPKEAQKSDSRPTRKTLNLHVTHRCNLACITCYVADFLLKGPDRLSFSNINSIMGIATANGFSDLIITGGEPLIRDDIDQILKIARSNFTHVALNTNGTALSGEICIMLKDLTDSITFSLDGPTAAVHDIIRGTGAFAKAMKGLKNLRASGYPMNRVGLSPTVNKQNYQGLENILDIAEEFGTDVSFGFFTPTGRGKCNRDTLLLDNEEMLGLFERAAAKRQEKLGITPSEDKTRVLDAIKTDCNICSIVTVQADGSFFPCPNLIQSEHCLGNFFSMNSAELQEMFRNPAGKKLYASRTVDRTPGCADCECRYFCGGGCMACAYEYSGNIYGQDPYCGFYKAVWLKYGPLGSKVGRKNVVITSDGVPPTQIASG